jgi:hypothetical protein
MGTGYTRNDSANNIADGNVINASDLDGEFDAVQAAFNASTGHSHDGTTGEGPKIDTAGLADDAVTGAKIDSTTTITAAGFTGPLTGTASNAALLDNIDSTSFLRSDAADTKTSGDLSFSDNVKATFGAGSDLQIFSDGTHGIIKESGSGDLLIYGNNLRLGNADGSELYILGNNNAEVQLRYDNATKLATTATGTNTTGISVATDTVGSSFNQFYALGNGNVGGIRFGNTTKTNGYIYYDNGGNMNFHADGPERMRIDSSGNLLVGTTTGGGTIGTYNGFGAFAGGSIFSAATSNRSIFSRRSTDGSIIEFRKDSTGVGVIGTQNWGIGTSNPAGPLEVHKSGGDANVFITTGVTTSSTTILFGDSASDDRGRVHYDHNNDSMRLHTAGSERMRITSAGNVGVGTASPERALHVEGAGLIKNTSGEALFKLQAANNSNSILELADTNDGNVGRVQYEHDNNAMLLYTNDSERMRIDSSGNVGIGGLPSQRLHVHGGAVQFTNTQNTYLQINTTDTHLYTAAAHPLRFGTNSTERMRIDSSGNLLVGKTSAASNVVGAFILNSGLIRADVDGGVANVMNRKTSDGDVAIFQKDGATVGSIGTGSSRLYVGTSNVGAYFASAEILPWNTSTNATRDDAISLGNSSGRFDDIFATNGTIQTSDQQEKNTITDSDLGLDFINRLSPKSYIFNGKTRTHYGLIAQDVETVLGDISKPTSGFAGFIKSDISDEQDGSEYRYGLRYTEFVGPLIQAIKDLKAENDAMRARLDALEAN